MILPQMILEQEFVQLAADYFLDDRLHLGRDELVLGLRREFRLRGLDRQYAGEPFAHVVAGRLDLGLLRELFLLDIAVERARHRLAQAREMRAAVALRNIVGKALHGLGVGIVPLHRNLDRDAVLLTAGMEDSRMQHRLAAIHVFDESLDASGKREVLALAVALVEQLDPDAVVEERELADPARQDVVMELDVVERRGRSLEVHFGAAPLGRTYDCERCDRNAVAEFHLVRFAVAPDPELEPLGEAIDDRNAHAVQPSRHLVRILVELAARVELGHDDLGRRTLLLVVVLDVGGDPASVIDDRHGIVGVDHDPDVIAVAGERFVDGVIEHLEHHVMQACAVGGVADVHSGTLAHGVEAFEHLDAVRIVVAAVVLGLRVVLAHSHLSRFSQSIKRRRRLLSRRRRHSR